MVAPASIKNTDAQSIITLYDSAGTPILLVAIDDMGSPAGLTPHAGRLGVATHQDGSTFVATEGIVVVGGVESGGTDIHKAAVDADGKFLTASAPASGALTDRSNTITLGGTAQTLAAINAARKYLFILNDADETEDLWINFTTAAVVASPSIRIPPGASFAMESSFVSPQLISVIAATTGHVFTAKEG